MNEIIESLILSRKLGINSHSTNLCLNEIDRLNNELEKANKIIFDNNQKLSNLKSKVKNKNKILRIVRDNLRATLVQRNKTMIELESIKNVNSMKSENWKCTKCGDNAPCYLEIKYSDIKIPDHLKGRQRLTKNVCLCSEHPCADWQQYN